MYIHTYIEKDLIREEREIQVILLQNLRDEKYKLNVVKMRYRNLLNENTKHTYKTSRNEDNLR